MSCVAPEIEGPLAVDGRKAAELGESWASFVMPSSDDPYEQVQFDPLA